MGHRWRWALTVVLLVLAGTLTACGVPTGPPKAIPAGHVPAQLVSPSQPPNTTIPPGGLSFKVFLIDSQNDLAPYNRVVAVHAGLQGILDYLVAGPAAPEIEVGVTTSIPVGTAVLSTSPPVNNVVTVNFSTDFGDPVTEQAQIQAIAQVVYTVASALQPTVSVLFEIDGAPISVPTGSGTETAQPVTIADYPGMVSTTTTTTTPTTQPVR